MGMDERQTELGEERDQELGGLDDDEKAEADSHTNELGRRGGVAGTGEEGEGVGGAGGPSRVV